MFENLRAAINAALDAATPDSDPRDVIGKMREAVIEARTSIELMREGVMKTEARLAAERQKLADEETRRLKREMERAAREAKADQQLDELKKKMEKG